MNKRQMLSYLLTLIIVGVMVGASEFLHEKEIIFPEITAIAIGALFAPIQSWNVSRTRLFLSITCMSIIGICIVRYIPFSLYIKIPLSFIVTIIALNISKSGFVPMISACMLPVIIGSDSIVYPLSVVMMSGLICIIQYILEKNHLHTHREYIPSQSQNIKFWSKHIVLICLIMIIPVYTKEMFLMVPPLIVGYVEMSMPHSLLRKKYKEVILLIGMAAILGVSGKILGFEYFHLSLTFIAVLVNAGILLVEYKMQLYLPPAGAIATLPMLLNSGHLFYYPIEVMIGMSILSIIALKCFKEKEIVL